MGKKPKDVIIEEEGEPICQCEHKKSEHFLEDENDENYGKCKVTIKEELESPTPKRCQCKGFFPMDPEDLEFLKELEGRE